MKICVNSKSLLIGLAIGVGLCFLMGASPLKEKTNKYHLYVDNGTIYVINTTNGHIRKAPTDDSEWNDFTNDKSIMYRSLW